MLTLLGRESGVSICGEIRDIEMLQDLVRADYEGWDRFGNVTAVYKGDLVLFNYTSKAQFEGRWNFFERISRGLIIHRRTGEIVARPFDKFFNWGEGGRHSSAPIQRVFEKLDGSLGILYRDNDKYKIATRGSFDSDQALWATDYARKHLKLNKVPDELTLLFEIIYPDNRIVVDYGDKEDLVLIGARNRFDGSELPWEEVVDLADQIGARVVDSYPILDMEEVIEFVNSRPASEMEGCVVLFEDGQRFKVKSESYIRAHRIRHSLSPKLVAEAIYYGELDGLLEGLPSDIQREVLDLADDIRLKELVFKSFLHFVMDQAPKDDQKTFALWVNKRFPDLAPYLFMMRNGQDIAPLYYRKAFGVNMSRNQK